jgi:hypothetical protein
VIAGEGMALLPHIATETGVFSGLFDVSGAGKVVLLLLLLNENGAPFSGDEKNGVVPDLKILFLGVKSKEAPADGGFGLGQVALAGAGSSTKSGRSSTSSLLVIVSDGLVGPTLMASSGGVMSANPGGTSDCEMPDSVCRNII